MNTGLPSDKIWGDLSRWAHVATDLLGLTLYGIDRENNEVYFLQIPWKDVFDLAKKNGQKMDLLEADRQRVKYVREMLEGPAGPLDQNE